MSANKIEEPRKSRYTYGPQLVQGHTFTVSSRYNLSQSGKILGKGSFGLVSSCVDTKTGAKIAVKRIRPYANDDWDARHTLREIRLMRLLDPHPNIISLYDVSLWDRKTELYLMMELMDCDMHKVIQSKQPLSDSHFKCFIRQLLEGVKTMHAMGIFHRDLKPGNILVSRDCQLRITDFGLARYMHNETLVGQNEQNPMTEYVVTRWYRAPELLLAPSKPYDSSIDLWSVGCILAELILRGPLFPGKSHAQQVSLVFEVLGFNEGDDVGFPLTAEAHTFLKKRCSGSGKGLKKCVPSAGADALALISSLLNVKPGKRPTAVEALKHAYLADAEQLYKYDEIDDLIQTTIISKGKVNSTFFDFEKDFYSTEALVNLIRREVGEHSQDLVQTREDATPEKVAPHAAATAAAASSDPASRVATAEAGAKNPRPEGGVDEDRVSTAEASHQTRSTASTSHAGDSMDVSDSQQEQEPEQDEGEGGEAMNVDGGEEATGEEVTATSAAPVGGGGGQAAAAAAAGMSLSPHRMGSIVRKSNKARVMQRVDSGTAAVAPPGVGGVKAGGGDGGGVGGMVITKSVLSSSNAAGRAGSANPAAAATSAADGSGKSGGKTKTAYNNGILRSLQSQAQSFMRSSRSAGGISGTTASGPPAKRPLLTSSRIGSAGGSGAQRSVPPTGNDSAAAVMTGQAVVQRPRAAPAGKLAALPTLQRKAAKPR